MANSVLSVDVEDWFHILDLPSAPDLASWSTLPSHVERNFHDLLDLFDRKSARATCFFLGWIAERFPRLVVDAARRGHEIASHGYAHQLVYGMTPDAFLTDIRKAKDILEAAAQKPVTGYRCPGFSVTEATPWFFEKVAQAGYRYDSSIFPAARGHGGLRSDRLAPYTIDTRHGPLVEFPITVTKVFGRAMCFFGGGYLRLFPYPVVRTMGKRVVRERRPIVFYVHPREIDPFHPRLPMSPLRRFKSYVGLDSTKKKLLRILDDFEVTTFDQLMAEHTMGGQE